MAASNQEFFKLKYLTIEEIQKMSIPELTYAVSKTAQYAEKRRNKVLKHFEEQQSPAYREYKIEMNKPKTFEKTGEQLYSWATYKFDIPKKALKSLNDNEKKNYLIAKLRKNQQFLRNKTSTVKGMERFLDKFEQRLNSKTGISIEKVKNVVNDKDKYNLLWELYNKTAKEYNPALSTNLSSNELQKEIIEILNLDDNKVNIEERISKLEEGKYKEESKEPIQDMFSVNEENDNYEDNKF